MNLDLKSRLAKPSLATGVALGLVALLLLGNWAGAAGHAGFSFTPAPSQPVASEATANAATFTLHLPVLFSGQTKPSSYPTATATRPATTQPTATTQPSPSPTSIPPASGQVYRVNAPRLSPFVFNEAAIFWFGQVTADENYADVRLGYTDEGLWVRVAVFDRQLWYDESPTIADLTNWDAISLYLDVGGRQDQPLGSSAYRYVGELTWWEQDAKFSAAYQGQNGAWVNASLPFTTTAGWRGAEPNDNEEDDRGWTLAYNIPYTSLGLDGPPSADQLWGLGVELHDRDDAAADPRLVRSWPVGFSPTNSSTWGELAFGLPSYSPPAGTQPGGLTTIRHKLDGSTVLDGMVGGGTECGTGLDFWTEWGDANYAGNDQVNVQNQDDVADWPCYSKFYITFPLETIPTGMEIISATLTIYQFGNSGGGQWGEAPPSLVQVLVVDRDWDEDTLTWNNAPLALENISRTWVAPLSEFPGWPGIAHTWDIGYAVSQAYQAGLPLRLALYSADAGYHTGRYFTSSDSDDWNANGRPILEITWGTH